MCGLSPVVASGGYSSLQCVGFSLQWLLLLWSTGSRCTGFSSCGTWASVVVARRPSCSAACGIFLDQGSNLCPLHWQADSLPLRHQGIPRIFNSFTFNYILIPLCVCMYVCVCVCVYVFSPSFPCVGFIRFSICQEGIHPICSLRVVTFTFLFILLNC